MSGEWWAVVIAPAFCIAMFIYLGTKLDLFNKIRDVLGRLKGDREFSVNFKVIKFEGIGKFFRRD